MSKFAFVTNTDSNTLSVVDLQTTEELKQIDIGESPRGAMAVDKVRGYGFVSNCAGNTISVINILEAESQGEIEVGLAPRGVDISPDNKWLFVANSGSATVTIIDLSTHEVVHTVAVERNPRQLQVSPNGKFVSVPNFGSDSISIINVDNSNIKNTKNIANINLGKYTRPYHAFPSEDGQLVFTANTFSHTVSVVSVADKKVIKTISVGYNPRAVITEPSGKYLIVSAEASNALCIIDRQTYQEIKRIDVGATPRGMDINTDNNTVCSTSFQRNHLFGAPSLGSTDASGDSVTVISLDTLTRVGNLPSGLGACSVKIIETDDVINGELIEANLNLVYV
ncbi:beta-propeller fold lactonase family protein [Lactococcus insecticola]|uniref:YNCE-like beta-propeller domain-containing protein n=1 Tax=Pseudolactococcus insecticola TaxID=2709158 RepID=A0A6A0B7I4_9LACT|nr:beta-propeller fold lactonase family protein [Lactococcus insecticola]GFH40623.1 hypothetical protein Hs20B_10210 [Lactococcus insecticola]